MAPTNDRKTSGYEKPQIKVMDEAEILKTFQITSAAVSWWH